MPKPSLEEQWPRSSSRSKDNSIVISFETLSTVDWYSRRPQKTQLHYYSDGNEEGDGEGKPASEADDEHEDDDDKKIAAQDYLHHEGAYKEGRGRIDKLDMRNGYGEGSLDQGHPFLAPFPLQPVYNKPSIAISSPGRDAKKAERAPRTYNSGVIPHSSNLLPHSGILLPSYMNIHHAGSHNSGTHAHNKGLASIKAANLIPAQLTGKLSKGRRAFNDANEPSSPKVTCFGRIKIKHKCYKEMGKLADVQTLALRSDKMQPSSKKNLNKGLENMFERGPPQNGEGTMAGVLSSAPSTTEFEKSKPGRAPHREVTTIADPASDSEAKVKKGIRKSLKEAKSHMKLHREKKKAHPLNASIASDYAASHVEVDIDLGRFRSSMQGKESSSLSNMSNGKYEVHHTGFVAQVPPPNSLVLMKNSKSRAACATLTSSFSTQSTSEDPHENGITVDGGADVSRQAYLSLLKGGNSKRGSSLLDVKLGELEVAAMANGFDRQGAYFSELDMKRICAVVADERKALHGKKNAVAHRQASLPKATREARLWQRRCILKPYDLDVGRPISVQVNQPTTR